MTVEEAVRIVREMLIGTRDRYTWIDPMRTAALETVLTGLAEQSKRADDWYAKAETLEAERDEARAEVERLQSEFESLLRTYNAAAQAWGKDEMTLVAERDEWRDTARSEMAGRAAAEAEIARLRLDLTEACRGGAVLARERNAAEAALATERERSERLRGLILRWAEEDPDCSGPSDALEAEARRIRAALAPAQPEEPGTGYTDSDGRPAGLGLEQP